MAAKSSLGATPMRGYPGCQSGNHSTRRSCFPLGNRLRHAEAGNAGPIGSESRRERREEVHAGGLRSAFISTTQSQGTIGRTEKKSRTFAGTRLDEWIRSRAGQRPRKKLRRGRKGCG